MRKESKRAKIRSLRKSNRTNAINAKRYVPRGGTRL